MDIEVFFLPVGVNMTEQPPLEAFGLSVSVFQYTRHILRGKNLPLFPNRERQRAASDNAADYLEVLCNVQDDWFVDEHLDACETVQKRKQMVQHLAILFSFGDFSTTSFLMKVLEDKSWTKTQNTKKLKWLLALTKLCIMPHVSSAINFTTLQS